jgi:hypothetical protein
MKREDVLNVDALKEQLRDGIDGLNRTLRGVFGEVVYALDTVIEKHNELEARLDTVSERLLRLEQHLGDKQ